MKWIDGLVEFNKNKRYKRSKGFKRSSRTLSRLPIANA